MPRNTDNLLTKLTLADMKKLLKFKESIDKLEAKKVQLVEDLGKIDADLLKVLAAAANSPLLFGKRLWWETRMGLFQQSIDTRRTTPHMREQVPRVSFGRHWVRSSALEIFREDIARFRTLLSTEIDDDPFVRRPGRRIP